MAIIPIIGNLIVGVALNLVGSWLSPKKQPKINEDLPNLGSGSPLFYCLGFTFVPTVLISVTSSSRSGYGADRTTACYLGLVNPVSTDLIAVRANNQIVSTKSTTSFPLAYIEDVGNYLNGAGMSTLKDVFFLFQGATPTPNPQFGVLGYPNIQYTGLTWIQFYNSLTSIVGGASSPCSLVVRNGQAAGISIAANGRGNQAVVLNCRGVRFDVFSETTLKFKANLPNGFRGLRFLRSFTWQNDPELQRDSLLFAIGNGSETCLGRSFFLDVIDQVSLEPYVAVPFNSALPLGNYYQNVLTDAVANLTGSATSVLLTSPGQLIRSVSIPASSTPIWGDGTNLRNSLGVIIGTKSANEAVVGWQNTVFSIDPANTNPGGQTLTAFQPNPIGSTTQLSGRTSLIEIFTTVLIGKGAVLSDFNFSGGFDQNVTGITFELTDVDTLINNLCTLYKKIVYEDHSGVLQFYDYSEVYARTPTRIGYEDLADVPSFVLAQATDQPETLEFTFRSTFKQMNSETISVGNGSSVNRQSISVDLVLDPAEAQALAWNALTLIQGTYCQATLLLKPEYNNIENGDVINFVLDESVPGDLLPGGDRVLKLLVVSSAYGADRTLEIECVNLFDLTTRISAQASTYTPPSPPAPIIPIPAVYKYLDAEPVPGQETSGGVVIARPIGSKTQRGAIVTQFADQLFTYRSIDENNLPPSSMLNTTIGSVSGVTYTNAKPSHGIKQLRIVLDSTQSSLAVTNGLLRVGQSWVKYDSATFVAPEWILNGVRSGFYGSTSAININDFVFQGHARSPIRLSGFSELASLTDAENKDKAGAFRMRFSVMDAIGSGTTPEPLMDYDVSVNNPYRTVAAGRITVSQNGDFLRIMLNVPGFDSPGQDEVTGLFRDKVPAANTPAVPYTQRIFEIRKTIGGTLLASFTTSIGVYDYLIQSVWQPPGTSITIKEVNSIGGEPFYGAFANVAIV